MPTFGQKSLSFLAGAHPDLQKVMHEAIKHYDFTVYCSIRNREDQERAFREGKSRAHFGSSPHNFTPSRAVDIAPWINGGIDWNNLKAFDEMGSVVLKAAQSVGVDITWGKNFTSLVDRPHFELTKWRDM